jgi:hypothetical protein
MPYHGSKRGKRRGEDEMGKKKEKFYIFHLLPEPKDSGKLSQSFSNSYASCWS